MAQQHPGGFTSRYARLEDKVRRLELRRMVPDALEWFDIGSQLTTADWDDAGDWGEPPAAALVGSGLVVMRGYVQYVGASASTILINVSDPLPEALRPVNVTTPGSGTLRRVSFALDVADNATAYKGAQGALNVADTGGVGLAVGGGVGLIGIDGTTYGAFPVNGYLSLDGLAYSL